MAALNKAALTAEILAQITSQTSPNSITPAVVGGVVQDIVDSMYDNVDGITISGLTLQQYIQQLIDQNNIIMGNAITQYLFSATKSLSQPMTNSGTSNDVVIFENDYTLPNFDTSNSHIILEKGIIL